MRRLLAVVAVAAAFATPSAASAAEYYRACTGTHDTNCHTWVCRTNCFKQSCDVYVNALQDARTAVCVSPVTA